MGKTAAPRRGAKKTVAKSTPKKKGKEYVLSIRLSTNKDWDRPLHMREVDRIMRASSLDMAVWSHVVGMSARTITKHIAANTEME